MNSYIRNSSVHITIKTVHISISTSGFTFDNHSRKKMKKRKVEELTLIGSRARPSRSLPSRQHGRTVTLSGCRGGSRRSGRSSGGGTRARSRTSFVMRRRLPPQIIRWMMCRDGSPTRPGGRRRRWPARTRGRSQWCWNVLIRDRTRWFAWLGCIGKQRKNIRHLSNQANQVNFYENKSFIFFLYNLGNFWDFHFEIMFVE